MKRFALRAGQDMAIDPSAIQRDSDGFFITLGPDTPPNERKGSVAIVHIRGALSHFKEDGGESYEGIIDRVHQAMECEDKPKAVVLQIESPGGVVSGLNETTKKLQAMSAHHGVPLIAYVNDLASSAAYHICCACEEILAPPSAVVGSVGVISTMVSVVQQDAMQGIEVRLITSGARKSDGHLHAPITDAAITAETKRNAELADQFFRVVNEARGLSVREIRGLEAGIYLAKEAKRRGLIDDVATLAEVLDGLEESVSRGPKPTLGRGNVTDRRAKEIPALDKSAYAASTSTLAQNGTPSEVRMAVKLDALIARTEAAIAAEQDPRKRIKLAATLAQYNATRVAMESEPPNGDEDDEDDEDDDESKSALAAKKAEEAKRKAIHAKHMEMAAKHKQKAAEYEEKAKAAMDDDEDDEEADEASSALAAPSAVSPSAAAITDHVSRNQSKRIKALEDTIAERDKASSVAAALGRGEITPHQAKMLADKSPAWVSEYLETTKGMRVVATSEGHMLVPEGKADAESGKADLAEIDKRIDAMGVKDSKQRETLRNEMLANRRSLQANGAAGRY
jgi:signal peptide peptidase SppA